MPATLRVSQANAVLRVVIDHPERKNALTPEMFSQLIACCRDLSASADPPRAALLSSQGEPFCAGFDLNALSTEVAEALPDDLVVKVMDAIEECPFPWVGALTGSAFGAGFELACVCDLRVGLCGSRYALPPARLGIVYAPRGLARFAACVGLPTAREMLLTGLPLSAERGYELGFLQRLADTRSQVLAEAETLTEALSQNAPLAVRHMRTAFQRMAREGMSDTLAQELEQQRRQSFGSQDAAEGLRAFFEKRAPKFRGE